jgi:hypothetical protein
LIEKDSKCFLFKVEQFNNVIALLKDHDLTDEEVFNIIKSCPDILISDRYSILTKKFKLFADLNINKSTIKNLILKYPFILVKSYNSFIRKVVYFNELELKIENIDIYPLIYVFNLATDIKPRCEVMKKCNKWIPFKEAFSISPSEFQSRMGITATEYDSFVEPSPLHERDLMFRYSKYLIL